jgi:CRP-like cAMP-binding protein
MIHGELIEALFMQDAAAAHSFAGGSLLGALCDEDREALLALGRRRSFAAGQTLFQRGDAGDFMALVLSGCVRVCLFSADGREITLNLIEAGQAVGEIAALDGKPRTADAVATGPVEALVIRRADLHARILQRPDLGLRLMEVLCQRLRRTSGQVEGLALYDLPGRLALLLLTLAEDYGAAGPDGVRIARKLAQGDLARLIGCTRESVNRQLRAWIEARIVAACDGGIVLRDPHALRALAQ